METIFNSLLPIEHFLLLALRRPERRSQSLASAYAALSDEELYLQAELNRVAPLVGHALQRELGPGKVPEPWGAAHERTRGHISALLEQADLIAGELAGAGVEVVILKNGGVARGLGHCLGCCPMGDVDLLVRPRDFARAHQAMIALGYQARFRDARLEQDHEAALAEGGGEYTRRLESGQEVWVEVQTRAVDGRWLQPSQEPPAEALLGRAQPIPGSRLKMLSPEDNLLQVALHTAKHSYLRAPGLRLHLDVERIVASTQLDWALFLHRVMRLKVKTAVYFSLRLAHELLGTPLPPGVLEMLQPAAVKREALIHMLRRAGLFDPDAPKFNRPEYLLFNFLLFDDLATFGRAVLPGELSGPAGQAGAGPPLAHLRRWRDLLWRRGRT